MEELETTWIDSKNCAEQSNSPATLGLSHMLGRYLNLPLARLAYRGEGGGREEEYSHSILTLLPLSPELDPCLKRGYPCDEGELEFGQVGLGKTGQCG